MKHELGVSADTLSSTLRSLVDQGWIEKNPGYGHPLRPEYILTDRGHLVAHAAQEFTQLSQPWVDVVYRRWSVPTLVAVQRGADRFNEIQISLKGISPRALAQGLRNLTDSKLILRSITDGYPPGTGYALTNDGATLAVAGERLLGLDRTM